MTALVILLVALLILRHLTTDRPSGRQPDPVLAILNSLPYREVRTARAEHIRTTGSFRRPQ